MTKTGILVAAMAAAVLATGAQAGSLADPVIEAPLIVEDASGSSSGATLVGLMAIVLSIPVLSD